MLLDEAMPRWDKREIHRIATDAPVEELFRAIEELTWSEVPVFKALMKVRGLGRDGLSGDDPLLGWFTSYGFELVDRTDEEMLIVRVERTRRGASHPGPQTVETFRADSDPGHVKIAFNFRSVDGYLTTETRVCSTDARSRRVFAAYWVGIRVGSAVIRRVWLRAIRARAQRAPMRRP
ncbi:hypothetical protein [Solicola gregarius]|uniref:DUF2867 domain-containing protein n=1 Tax=Solicola gregarius TaxID=2908642 RepID=A0AA46TK15_9ACTN|nr:hypothetical protein [Solicola gregarius]UYM06711.1 hypothetical protein L0C25_06470 [Solicola gregarius]